MAILRSWAIGSPDAGYTLIELLVVLSIIGLLLLSAPTVVSAAFPGVRAKTVAHEFATALRGARQTAILTEVEVRVTLQADGSAYVVEPGHTVHELPRGVSVSVDVSHQARFIVWRFYPDGSSSGGTARVVAGSHVHTVTNHPLTGRIGIDE